MDTKHNDDILKTIKREPLKERDGQPPATPQPKKTIISNKEIVMLQMSLFENYEAKLSDFYNLIHNFGKWQDENCYKTTIVKIKDTVIISNHCTYGDKNNKERSMNTAVFTINEEGYLKLSSIEIGRITLKLLQSQQFIFNETLYKNYCIYNDIGKIAVASPC